MTPTFIAKAFSLSTDEFFTFRKTEASDTRFDISLGGDLRNEAEVNANVVFTTDKPDNTVFNSGVIDGTIDFNIGNDVYRGSGNGLTTGLVSGGQGKDKMFGTGQVDKFSGGKGNDILRGGAGNDKLKGGTGKDELTGAKGRDKMSGGGGDDVFVFKGKTGTDTITDFENGADRLDLSAFDISSTKQLKNKGALVSDGDGGTIVNLDKIGGSGEIRIDDMSLGQWNNADFIF